MWTDYLEDYEFTLHYHPSKKNVVANALSRKSRVLASVASREWQMLEIVGQFGLRYSGQAQEQVKAKHQVPFDLLNLIQFHNGSGTT